MGNFEQDEKTRCSLVHERRADDRTRAAFDLHGRLNRIRKLIVAEIRDRAGKDLPELIAAERALTDQFAQAVQAMGGAL